MPSPVRLLLIENHSYRRILGSGLENFQRIDSLKFESLFHYSSLYSSQRLNIIQLISGSIVEGHFDNAFYEPP